jgi:hypothetical protein
MVARGTEIALSIIIGARGHFCDHLTVNSLLIVEIHMITSGII